MSTKLIKRERETLTSWELRLDPPTRSDGGWETRQRAAKEGGAWPGGSAAEEELASA